MKLFLSRESGKLELICHHCGKKFEGKNEKFCHDSCRDAHIMKLDKKVREAVKNDPSHIREMSKDF